jgi:hypothetical protein
MVKNIKKYSDLFGKKLYELKREIDTLPEDFLNMYVIHTCYFHQYALGVTGAHRNECVYVSEEGLGYPYAAAAYKDAKDHGIKPYTKNGEKTPYGELGAKQYTRKAITVREALETGVYEFRKIA